MKQKMMGNLANYFDYEAFARELFNRDYTMGANGHVFRRIWPLHPLCIKGFSERKGSFARGYKKRSRADKMHDFFSLLECWCRD